MIYSLIFQDHLLEALYTFDTDGCNVSTLHFQISVEIVFLKKINFVETHYIGSEIGHGVHHQNCVKSLEASFMKIGFNRDN